MHFVSGMKPVWSLLTTVVPLSPTCLSVSAMCFECATCAYHILRNTTMFTCQNCSQYCEIQRCLHAKNVHNKIIVPYQLLIYSWHRSTMRFECAVWRYSTTIHPNFSLCACTAGCLGARSWVPVKGHPIHWPNPVTTPLHSLRLHSLPVTTPKKLSQCIHTLPCRASGDGTTACFAWRRSAARLRAVQHLEFLRHRSSTHSAMDAIFCGEKYVGEGLWKEIDHNALWLGGSAIVGRTTIVSVFLSIAELEITRETCTGWLYVAVALRRTPEVKAFLREVCR